MRADELGKPETKQRVLVTSWIVDDESILDLLRRAGVEVVMARQPAFRTAEEMIPLVDGIHGVIAASDVYNAAVMDAGPLRVISRVGVGYDAIDVRAATERGIAVCTTPGTNHDSVADHTFGLILALARQIIPQDRWVKDQRWKRLTAADVNGQTLGILGLGKIGKGVARRARGFDMRVVAFDPIWDEAFAIQHGVERLPLDRVIREADFLSLHLPATAETHHILDATRLALLKPTAFLVNCARGTLIDEAALYEALKAGRIAGAGLDVFDHEPPWGSKLLELENVILTPHVAGFSVKANAGGAKMAVENALLVLQGKRPHFCVNPEVLE